MKLRILNNLLLPIHPLIAVRERCTGFWTGDVWKMALYLKAVQPDKNIVTSPVLSSGLAVVTNLDPPSKTLVQHFDSIVEHFACLNMHEFMKEHMPFMNCVPSGQSGMRTVPRMLGSVAHPAGSDFCHTVFSTGDKF